MSEDTERQARLTEVAAIAVALETKTGCPAPMMIAQWAVESHWGAEPVGKSNYFGIKANCRAPESCISKTTEVVDGKTVGESLPFADYDSLEASCEDYTVLITQGQPYSDAWASYRETGDLNALIVAVAAKYATSTQYASLVSLIARQQNVARAIADARQEAASA
jgi:flagellum-specific peptidoglycan hydrolase FlgJ